MFITESFKKVIGAKGAKPTQKYLIYDAMIRPFLDPFLDLAVHTVPKIIVSLSVMVVMIFGVFQNLIDTPSDLWLGLFILAVLDFIAGTLRAIFDTNINFSIHRWGRSAYKMTSYVIVILATSVAGNMYPHIFGWVQFLVVAILVGLELFSVARHLKMTAVFSAAIGLARGTIDAKGKNLAEIIQEIDAATIKKKQDRIRQIPPEKDKK